jgi:hypothetical protein
MVTIAFFKVHGYLCVLGSPARCMHMHAKCLLRCCGCEVRVHLLLGDTKAEQALCNIMLY